MSIRTITALWMSLGMGTVAFAGCGGPGGDTGEKGTGSNAACSLSSDCPDTEVCVRVGSDAACTINCTVEVDACGGSATCAGVGSVGVNVCQEKKKAEPSADDPPDPKEEAFLPCGSDADCDKLSAGAICAEWQGSRDCSIPCSADSECNPPPVGGVGTAFFGCLPDESNTSRKVCLPREECWNDPLACITGLPDETSGGAGAGFPNGGAGVGGSF